MCRTPYLIIYVSLQPGMITPTSWVFLNGLDKTHMPLCVTYRLSTTQPLHLTIRMHNRQNTTCLQYLSLHLHIFGSFSNFDLIFFLPCFFRRDLSFGVLVQKSLFWPKSRYGVSKKTGSISWKFKILPPSC